MAALEQTVRSLGQVDPAVYDPEDAAQLSYPRDPRRRARFIGRALRIVDCCSIIAAFALVEFIFSHRGGTGSRLDTVEETALLVLSLPTWLFLAKAQGLYDRDQTRADHSTADELAPIGQLLTFGSWIVLVAAYVVGLHPYLPRFIAFWGASLVVLVAGRALTRAVAHRARPYVQRTLIVGAGDVGQLVATKLVSHGHFGIDLVGFVDADPRSRSLQLRGIPVLGSPGEIDEIVRRFSVDRVIIAFSRDLDEQTLSVIRALRDERVQIDIVPRLFDSLGPRATLHTLGGFPLVSVSEPAFSLSSLFLKRCFDVVGSAVLLLVLAPLFAYIALQIKLDSPGPVFYRQQRIGRRGHTFKIMKFRTMRSDADAHLSRLFAEDESLRLEFEAMHKLTSDPRVTRVGAFLRRSSLDELPQIINVLLGDMSLVGPRPIVEAERHRYREDVERLIDVPPGMTGYWQISGRSNVSYPERVRLDLAYVRNWSLGLDLLILAKTARALFSRQGAY